MSEVRKGTSRNTENENKRCKKETNKKKINKKKLKKNLYDSLVLYLTKKWLNP
jgi:hypothetical protein